MEEEKEKKNKINNNKNKGKSKRKIKNKKNNSKKQEITSGNTIESSLENIINTNTANTLDSGNNNQNNKNNNNSNSSNNKKKNNKKDNKKNKKIKSAAGEIDDLDDLDHSQYASNIDEIDTLTKKDAEKENNNKDKIAIKSKDDKRVVLDAVGKLKVDDVETEEQLDKLQEKTNKKLKEIEEKKEAISDEKFEENIQKKVIEKLGNRHKKKILLITTIIVLIAICVISTIFSVIYMGKDVIVPNIYIGSINIGGLTKEAKDKILKIYEEKATKDIRASLKDYEQIIKTEMVEFAPDVAKAVDNAYMIGRNGNIIENNYTIISRYFNNKNIEISYHVNEELMKKLLEEIAGKIPEKVKEPSYNIDGTKLLVYPGTRGYEVNKLSLREMIVSIMLDVDKKTEEDLKITIPVDLKEPNNIDIEKIHNEIYEKPENATYNEETKELKLDKDGLDFAITIEEAKNIIRENKEEYTIPLKKVKADITYDKLGKDIFPDLLRNISNKL